MESPAQRWLYAAKPGSWPKLLVPALLGQALGVAAGGRSWLALGLGAAFVVCDLLFIVFLNDWADRDVDRLKRELFPDGCSPKTIPDGILPAHHLLAGGVAAGLAALAVAGVAAFALGRPWLLPAAAGCLAIFAAYSLPPFRLNYRGGGELLEMVGVGVALPLLHQYLQAGTVGAPATALLPGWACLCLASGIASGLSDEESDRRGGKTTFASRLGNRVARRLTEGAMLVGIGVWLLAALHEPRAAIPGALVAGWHARRVLATSDAAITNAFGAQKRYKHHLHLAIWHGGAMVAAASLLST